MEIDVLIGICIIAIMVIIYMKYKKPSYKTETKCENIKRTEDTIDTYDDKENKRVSVGIYKPNEKSTEEEITYTKDGVQGKGAMKRMVQGLQIFNENGEAMLDITDTLTSITGEITCNKTNGKLYVNGLNGRNIWLVEKDSEIFDSSNFEDEMNLNYPVFPIVRVDGDYIVWEYPEAYIDRTSGSVDAWMWLNSTYYIPSMFGGAVPVSVTYLFGVI